MNIGGRNAGAQTCAPYALTVTRLHPADHALAFVLELLDGMGPHERRSPPQPSGCLAAGAEQLFEPFRAYAPDGKQHFKRVGNVDPSLAETG